MPQNLTTAHSNCSCRLQNWNRKTERERAYVRELHTKFEQQTLCENCQLHYSKREKCSDEKQKKEEKQNSTSVSTIIKLHFT